MLIEVVYPDSTSEKFNFKNNTLILGRSKKADISLNVEGLSRQHMQVDQVGEDIFVTDLNSTNGLYVGNEKIPAGQKVKYINILPLQMGPLFIIIKTAEAEAEEEAKIKETLTASFTQAELGTMNSQRVARTASNKTVAAKKVPQKSKIKVSNLILGLSLMIGGYFYYDYVVKLKISNDLAKAELEQVKKLEAKAIAIKNIKLLDHSDLRKLASKELCIGEELAKLCTSLALNSANKEGIIIDQQTAAIFVKKDALKPKIETSLYKALEESTRQEYLLIARFLTPSTLKTLSLLKVKLVQVSSISFENEMVKVLFTLGAPAEEDFKMNDESFINTMDFLIYNGKPTFFEQHIKKKLIY